MWALKKSPERYTDMSDFNYNPDIYTLSDENGEEHTFELLDTMELDGNVYYAMVPVYDDPAKSIEGDAELVVLKLEDPDDEETLITIDDDEEYERIGGIFLERLENYYDADDEEDGDFDGDDYEGEES